MPSRNRRRKTRRTQGKPKQGARVAKIYQLLLIVALLLLVVAGIGYWRVNVFLHGAGLRDLVEEKVQKRTGLEMEIAPLRWSGLTLKTANVNAISSQALVSAELQQVAATISTNYVLRDAWVVSDVQVGEMQAVLDVTKPFALPVVEGDPPSGWLMQQLPQEVELRDVTVDALSLQLLTALGPIGVEGMQLGLEQAGSGYQITLNGGTCLSPFGILERFELDRAKLRTIGDDEILVQQFDVRAFDHASIRSTGEVVKGSNGNWLYDFGAQVDGLRLEEVIDEDWKQRLQGELEGTLGFKLDETQGARTHGSLRVTEASLTALPVLDTITAYTGVPDFRKLRIDSFTADYHHADGKWALNDIKGVSKGLMQVSGWLTWDQTEVRGSLDLGVHPRALAKIPGAEGRVFIPKNDGMAWTTVAISGTPDDIKEDLTERLKAAAIGRVLEIVTGTDALGRSTDFAKEVAQPALESTGEVIKEGAKVPLQLGSDALEAGAGLFGGFFGGDPKVEPEEDAVEE